MIDATSRKKDLLKLPEAPFNNPKKYPFLLIVPTKELHDSGYRHIAIIGGTYVNNKPMAVEVLAYPDDITFPIPEYSYLMRMDCFGDNGVLRLHSIAYDFFVSCPVSSTEIEISKRVKVSK
jgi:hypothetical protein